MSKNQYVKGVIKIDIYCTSIIVCVVPSKEIIEFSNNIIKSLKGEIKIESEVYGLFINGPKNYIIINKDSGLNINTITHEVYHCTQYILEARNIEDEEASAWLNGYLNEKILNLVFKSED